MRKILQSLMLLLVIATSSYSQDFFINEKFRDALVENGVDTDNDGYISKAEAHAVTLINVEKKKLTDLTGIAEFINLKTLRCAYNYLGTLDLSNNTLLEEVQCFQNRLNSLNVSGCTELERLYCFENNLTSIDVTKNPKLRDFQLYDNKITSLDLKSNTILTRLDFARNRVSEFDVSLNPDLVFLVCGGNLLQYIDVSYNTELRELYCGYNDAITSLDLTRCRKLEKMDASNSPHLQTICVWNVSNAISNPYFYKDAHTDYVTDCALNFKGSNFKNKLTELNLDKNGDGFISLSEVKNVKILNVDGSPFGKLNDIKLDNINGIEGFVNLENLSMSFNNVKSMDISRNTKLKSLSCKNNGMTSLDVSNNTSLTALKCTGNNLSKIYVWDIAYAESNPSFRKDASASWAIHEELKNDYIDLFKVKMYPVPLRDFIIIESDVDAELTIYNLLGVEVLKDIKIEKGYNRINLDLKLGVYICSLQNEKNIIVRRIVIE